MKVTMLNCEVRCPACKHQETVTITAQEIATRRCAKCGSTVNLTIVDDFLPLDASAHPSAKDAT